MRKPPAGNYLGEFVVRNPKRYRATGEWRAPKKGEFYLSGAFIQAWRAPNDYNEDDKFWIAREVRMIPQPDKWEWISA